MTTPADRIEDLVSKLLAATPGLKLHVDRAEDPTGESFIDIRNGEFETQVSFKPAFGFGLFLRDGVFGQRPDEIVSTPEAVVARLFPSDSSGGKGVRQSHGPGWTRSGGVTARASGISIATR